MHPKRREKLLKIGVGVIVGLFLLDQLVISWLVSSWKERSTRIASLREKVEGGKKLIARGPALRNRWAEMQRTDLPEDEKRAANEVINAMNRWRRESRIPGYTGYTTPQPIVHEDEGYEVLDCIATAAYDQGSLARLLFELETDPLATRVTKLELQAKDAEGKQLELNLRFNFLRLIETKKGRR